MKVRKQTYEYESFIVLLTLMLPTTRFASRFSIKFVVSIIESRENTNFVGNKKEINVWPDGLL